MDEIEVIDFDLYQGDDEDIVFEIFEVDETQKTENEYDVSSLPFDLWLKPDKGSVIQFSSTTGELDVVDNMVTIKFRNKHTAKAKWRIAEYDLQTVINDKIKTLVKGTITLEPDITKKKPTI